MTLLDNLLTVDPDIAERIDALDLSFNKFGVDPYGIAKHDLVRFVSAFAWFYRHYFKVDVYGLENVPSHGRAILVGNHSGGVAIDGAMVMGSMLLAYGVRQGYAQSTAEKELIKQYEYRVSEHITARRLLDQIQLQQFNFQ